MATETENAEIVNFVYEFDDGQVIELYEGGDLPFPLLVAAENGVAQSYGQSADEQTDESTVDLSSVEYLLESQLSELQTINQNLCDSVGVASALVGVVIGFLAARELLKIWL